MYPGVYYNGVCRATTSRAVNNYTNSTIRHPGIATQSNTTIYNTNKSIIEHVHKLGIPRPIIPQQIHAAIAASKPIILSNNKHLLAPNDLPNNRALPNNARLALITRLEEGLVRAHAQRNKYNYKQSLDKIITEVDNELQSMLKKHIEYQKTYNKEKEERNKWEDILCNAKARLSNKSISSLVPNITDEQNISNARNEIAIYTQRENNDWNPYFKTYDTTIQNLTKKRDNLIIQQQQFNDQLAINKKRLNSMKRGGGPLPLRYFDPNAYQSSASAGSDVLGVSGLEVRPKIGGKARRTSRRASKRAKRSTKRARRTKGGFVPSVMESFVAGASNYVAPLALYTGYKLMNRSTRK
jgi:hypothetical protein